MKALTVLLGVTVSLSLAACGGGGPSAPSNAGSVLVLHLQPGSADNPSGAVSSWTSKMTATEITLDQVHSGMVVAGPGTPNAGTAYVPEMSNVLAEIRPDNSLLKLALPAEPENLVVAPYGTKDAGFVFVKLKAGVVVLKPDGSLTSLAISDPNDIAVAPAGTARAGDLFVTSVSSGTLYEVDASTLSVRTIETDLFPATIVMAPAGTDSAGELYLVPGGRTGGDGAAAARIAVVSKERAVSYVPLASAGDDISLAAVSPKDTPTAGTVYVADATNGNVYEIHPDHRVTTVRVDPAGDVGFETLEVASSGSANAGVAYIDEGDGGHVFAIETNGSVRSVSTLAQVHLLAIAPTGTPNAGTLYLSEGKTEVQVVKPDGKTTNLAGLTYDAVSATVAPAGTPNAGAVYLSSFFTTGVDIISVDGQLGQMGASSGVVDVLVVPARVA